MPVNTAETFELWFNYSYDEIIDKYLKHITDVKPITARQCIRLLPVVAKYKPELKNDIISAIEQPELQLYIANFGKADDW